jgi:Tfp pilus assembly protein PilF
MVLNPDNAFIHKTFGILQEIRGDKAQSELDKERLYKEAEKEYRKALELNPTYPSARRHLASSLEKLKRHEEAENEYKQGKKITKEYPKNNMDFGIFLSKLGRKEDAKKELSVAAELFRKQGKEEDAKKAEEILKNLS